MPHAEDNEDDDDEIEEGAGSFDDRSSLLCGRWLIPTDDETLAPYTKPRRESSACDRPPEPSGELPAVAPPLIPLDVDDGRSSSVPLVFKAEFLDATPDRK